MQTGNKRKVGGPYRDQYFDAYFDYIRETTDIERKNEGKAAYSDVTIKTMATDTFFLEKHDDHDFGYWLKSDTAMDEAYDVLLKHFKGRRNPVADATYYQNCMNRFRRRLNQK